MAPLEKEKISMQPYFNLQGDSNEKRAELYNCQNINTLFWPDGEDSDYIKRFLLPLMQHGIHHYIDNVQTQLQILKVGNQILPITINDADYQNSYVCSPYSFYVSYALESLDLIQNPSLRQMTKHSLQRLSKILRHGGMNKVVMVNNWPFSTNLYPQLDSHELKAVIQTLTHAFPDHAILFRSINFALNADECQVFKEIGAHFIASRQIYITNTQTTPLFDTRIFKSDLRLLNKTDYSLIDGSEICEKDYPRILELYQSVYIDKYSKLNPQLNLHFIELALKQQILHIKALKKEGQIDGVVGYFCREGVMTCPFFGYDREKPQELGLYRLLSTILMLEAKKNNKIFHQSAGASFYKQVRRAESHLEYLVVYDKHLSYRRKLIWLLVKSIFNSFGVSFMKKY